MIHDHACRLAKWLLVLALIMSIHSRSFAASTVLNFDDLSSPNNLTGSNYSELSWEEGNIGVGGIPGHWATVYNHANLPNSGLGNLINAGGSTSIAIGFPMRVDVTGAYIAGQGAQLAWASSLRVHGFRMGQEVSVTSWFTPITSTPTWFDMSSLTNVDRVLFESVASYQNQGYYGLDDLTFTYIPEPASLAMLTLAGAGLLARRRRHR